MSKTFTFTLGIVLALTTWLAAERTYHHALEINLLTSFDFSTYPACSTRQVASCIQGIRFYDAESKHILAEVPVSRGMTGWQQIVGRATVTSIPRAVYAVTVYVDISGQTRESRPGDVRELKDSTD